MCAQFKIKLFYTDNQEGGVLIEI